MMLARFALLLTVGVGTGCLLVSDVAAQVPDHPIITEVYFDPPGNNDAPVGADSANAHQEYIELYLPMPPLDAGLNKDALNLAIYEVEGDQTSSGYRLVNYRIDLPKFDVDSSNGITSGAIARPSSGVVVVGWVDYVYSDAGTCSGDSSACSVSAQNCVDESRCSGIPTDLAGTPSTRVGMVNGGITSPGDYVFIALNGMQYGGTSNFPAALAMSHIKMPSEANSGVIQNGSGAYLLVDRDDVGYVTLYDDKDPDHQPAIPNADPALADGNVLWTSCFLDGLATNDDSAFVVVDQPYPLGGGVDLDEVLPDGGAYSLLIPQLPEEGDLVGPIPGPTNGHARVYVDVPKTTENVSSLDDDPVADAQNAYRHSRVEGPFYPTPGQVVLTTSPPELAVSSAVLQTIDVLSQTTHPLGILAANVGGDYPIDMSALPGASSNPTVATFGLGSAALAVPGQSFGYPGVEITGLSTASHEASASAAVTVTASSTNPGDPIVVGPVQATTVTATVLNPTTGLSATGQPFQTTVFVAVQGIAADVGVSNEFAASELGQWLSAQPDISALQTLGNALDLLDPASDISDPVLVRPMIKELPGDGEECMNWKNPAGPPTRLSFAETVTESAEVASGAITYDASIGVCDTTSQTVIKAIRVNVPDTLAYGGVFAPSQKVHFVDPSGDVGSPASGLTDVTTSRTFEIALIDTSVRFDGSLETGRTDDFGMIIEVLETEPGSPVVPGEFVLLSVTGGLQGADIDTLDVPPGDLVATIIYLDLDNLHDVLGIRSIESLYVIDAGASGEVEIIEGFSLNPAGSFLSSAVPATDESLWRSNNNTVRITFSTDITTPVPGEVLVQQLLSGGGFETDISSGFEFTVENNLNGRPRILRIADVDPPDLMHRRWYTFRSVGGWPGGGDFAVDYVVQFGDADNDGAVLNLDVGLINVGIPDLGPDDQDRRDVDGDGAILNADVSTTNVYIPSLPVQKPGGH